MLTITDRAGADPGLDQGVDWAGGGGLGLDKGRREVGGEGMGGSVVAMCCPTDHIKPGDMRRSRGRQAGRLPLKLLPLNSSWTLILPSPSLSLI